MTSSAGVIELSTRIQKVIIRTPTVKSFRFEISEYFPFKAGQFMMVSVGEAPELTKCLSISNSPTEQGYLEVTKKITDSEFSQMLNRIQPGYELKIKFPLGRFTFEGEHNKLALLSGGIGITPLRSICKFVTDKKLGTEICLLYSNRTVDEIAFRSDFEPMQENYGNLRVVHTLTRAEASWSGRTGRIDAELVREEIPDYQERYFYICGPPKMVEGLDNLLKNELGLAAQQVKTEKFAGY